MEIILFLKLVICVYIINNQIEKKIDAQERF